MILLFLFVVTNFITIHGLNNGLALTPPMGFLTWQRFRCTIDCRKHPKECISDDLIRRTARAMVDKGYLNAGYDYITIDDCWPEWQRSPNGTVIENKERFPRGMKDLADYVMSLGFKFGIYADIGTKTCEGYPGLEGNMEQDMATYASYGSKYIKVDGCYIDTDRMAEAFINLSKIISTKYKSILFSCVWPTYIEDKKIKVNYTEVAETCNIWRSYADIQDTLTSFWDILNHYQENPESYAAGKKGSWNDPDMLLIGGYSLSLDIQRIQMAVWCLMPAPLMISADFDDVSLDSLRILQNRLAISINQDLLGKAGRYIKYESFKGIGGVWCRPLIDGLAFALINKEKHKDMEYFNTSIIGISPSTFGIYKDVFTFVEKPLEDILDLEINPEGVRFIKVIYDRDNNLGTACEPISASSVSKQARGRKINKKNFN